jgi:acetyl-CoA synthetase
MRPDTFVWEPTPELLERTSLSAFLRVSSLANYEALCSRANADPAWLWDAVLRFFEVRFHRPYSRVLDLSRGIEWPQWCLDGETNLVTNSLDRHRGTPAWKRDAIVWESEAGAVCHWSYAKLHAETCRLAGALQALGIGKGDVVALYVPMLPEVAAAFFAVAKIGAIVMPLFSGFGPRPILDRLNHSEARVIITADCGWRRGTRMAMKATLDEVASDAPSLQHIVVLRRDGNAPMQPGRDLWWQDIVASQPDEMPTAPLPAETPVMLMYTSGTTGSAKGTIHTHCGVMGKNLLDVGLCLDLQAGERVMWLSDMGWVAGPKVVMSAALLGATLVMAEGTPDYPDATIALDRTASRDAARHRAHGRASSHARRYRDRK